MVSTIRKFSRQVHEWKELCDAFSSAIQNNEHIADLSKIKYLCGYLDGSARSVVAVIPTKGSTYAIAVDLLKKRFGNPHIIERSHKNHLISFGPVFRERNMSRPCQLLIQRYTQVLWCYFLIAKMVESILLSMIHVGNKNKLEWTIEVKVKESHMLLRHKPAPPV